jgi:hypothetical protein
VQGEYRTSWTGPDDPSRNLVNGNPYYAVINPYTGGETDYGYPITISPGGVYPTITYSGFDPSTAPNNGTGFSKNLSGNELPNAPPFTVSFSADYTIPVTPIGLPP